MSDSDNSSVASDPDPSTMESKKRAASLDATGMNKYEEGDGFEDETLQCRDCEKDFIFTAEDQAFHASKGFENKPVRCADCRNSKKQRLDGGGRGRGGRGYGGGGGGGGGDRSCYNCGGSGHMSRDCPEPRKESSGRGGGRGYGGRGRGSGRGGGRFGGSRDRY